ncbi:thioredoxin domain-containing protein [Streptomyces sp. SM11]|uniref:DsbA family protein n=1 Tax=Streptomyces sp. SM11 TaxID=565557 RepID=UPI000CD5088A|nr:thioredoxin domain-containing protein [Streptomyces sp. SM11]
MVKPRRSPAAGSARARLAALRRQKAERARRRKTLVRTGVAATTLATVVAVTIAVQSYKEGDDRPVVVPQGAAGPQGLVIPTGKDDAPVTLAVYEDFRCPGCGQVEDRLGPTINELQDEGKLRVEYHVLSLVDNIVPGKGSLRAASAAAAAQEAGKFREYHDVLFDNQPEETDDAFGNKDLLLTLADGIDGLNTPEFAERVRAGTHDTWAKKVQQSFDRQTAIQGTPAMFLDGGKTDLLKDPQHPLTAERLTQLVDTAAQAKTGR